MLWKVCISTRAALAFSRAATVHLTPWRSSSSIRCASRVAWRGALIGATASDEHYATVLDLEEAATMLSEKGFLWSAAAADAAARGLSPEKYLSGVSTAARDFVLRRELHDREASTAAILGVLSVEGQLGLVLGGKSVGKTFLLGKLAGQLNEECEAQRAPQAATAMRGGVLLDSPTAAPARMPRRVVVYNARDAGADLSNGLVSVLKGDPSFFQRFKVAFKTIGEHGTAAAVTAAVSQTPLGPFAPKLGNTAGKVAGDFIDASLADRPLPLNQVLAAFILSCKEAHCYPCLIIDEANAALIANSDAARERTLAALRLLVEFTKETSQMNVILASSEHSEPFRLNELGFKSDHWTRTLVVGEVSEDQTSGLPFVVRLVFFCFAGSTRSGRSRS